MSTIPGFGASSHRGRIGRVPRCQRCGMQAHHCLCPELQPLALATRVIVVRTPREEQQLTNSGRLVPLVLAGGEVHLRGDALPLDPARQNLLLFSGPRSRELVRDPADPRPVTLFVPDGTWRAARRMAIREPSLAGLDCVHLPPGPPSRYLLRSHPDPRCLATVEAIARALGILEGPEVQARLEHIFELFVERTLRSRGQLWRREGGA